MLQRMACGGGQEFSDVVQVVLVSLRGLVCHSWRRDTCWKGYPAWGLKVE